MHFGQTGREAARHVVPRHPTSLFEKSPCGLMGKSVSDIVPTASEELKACLPSLLQETDEKSWVESLADKHREFTDDLKLRTFLFSLLLVFFLSISLSLLLIVRKKREKSHKLATTFIFQAGTLYSASGSTQRANINVRLPARCTTRCAHS